MGREEVGTVFWGIAQRTAGLLRQFLFHKMEIGGEKLVVRPCLISGYCCYCPLSHQRIAQGFTWQHLDVMKCFLPQWSQKAPVINVPCSGSSQSSIVLSVYYLSTANAELGSWESFFGLSVTDGCWDADWPIAMSFPAPTGCLSSWLPQIWVSTPQILHSDPDRIVSLTRSW